VTRAKPLQPKSNPERRLLEAVERQFASNAAFYREAAARLGTKEEAEKSAFNRIIRGQVGDKTARRIRAYAELLNADPGDFLRPSEQREAGEDELSWAVRRLGELQDEADRTRLLLESVLKGLKKAGIAIQDPQATTRSAATAAPASRPRGRNR